MGDEMKAAIIALFNSSCHTSTMKTLHGVIIACGMLWCLAGCVPEEHASSDTSSARPVSSESEEQTQQFVQGCPFEVAYIREVEQSLQQRSNQLLNYPGSIDSRARVYTMLLLTERILTADGCEFAEDWFHQAKANANHAIKMADFHLDVHLKTLDAALGMIP